MSTVPRKAFILAAGFGTRLKPLTLHTPKPMLPLWDVPMLERTLHMMTDWGVHDVLINLHHLPGPIVSYLARRSMPGLRISTVFEPDILGTGGALRHAAWFLDQPCWLLNADIVAMLQPDALLREWNAKRPNGRRPLSVCWLTRQAGPKTVVCRNGRITRFHDVDKGRFTFCGLQLLDPSILRYIAPDGFDTIIAAYQRGQAAGGWIAGVEVKQSFWADIGTPAQYVQAHRDTAASFGQGRASLTLPAAITFSPQERRVMQKTFSVSPREADELTVEVLPPRNSAREFFRLRLPENIHPLTRRTATALAVRWSPARTENRLYAGHTRFLEAIGMPVPYLVADAPRTHFLLMEDLGGDTVESRFPQLPPAAGSRLYRHILEMTLLLHRDGSAAAKKCRLPLMPAFDAALYQWEHDYFLEHFCRGRLHLSAGACRKLQRTLTEAAGQLMASPQALIHRDWQSSNILFRGRRPVMIDYQGMRRGAIAYDLASLLADPYVDLPEAQQLRLLDYYLKRHPEAAAIRAAYPAAVVQRLCQTLGAYALISAQPGMARFAAYIAPALRQLARHAPAAFMDALGANEK